MTRHLSCGECVDGPGRFGKRWLLTFTLGAVAPLVLAQVVLRSTDGSVHGATPQDPQPPACPQRVDDPNLPLGAERKSFMRGCPISATAAADAAQIQALVDEAHADDWARVPGDARFLLIAPQADVRTR